jgi:hypothetical protein
VTDLVEHGNDEMVGGMRMGMGKGARVVSLDLQIWSRMGKVELGRLRLVGC